MTTSAELNRVITQLRSTIPELRGVMIASGDGLPIAYDFADDDAERMAAVAATILRLGGMLSEQAAIGGLHETVARGDDGYLVTCPAGSSAVLLVAAPTDANLVQIRLESVATASEIQQVLS